MNKSPNEPADMIDSDDSSNSEYRLISDSNDTCNGNANGGDLKPIERGFQMTYVDLLSDLFKTSPNPEYGHYDSYSYTWYCEDCQMVLHPNSMYLIPCKVPKFVVRQDGTVVCVHAKCKRLDLAEHFRLMEDNCSSWKRTYWRAWSECHFLSCASCKQAYPVRSSAMCQYHPEEPEYFPLVSLCSEQPIGRYPCCGQRAFRFEVVKNPFGCKFRMHIPIVKNDCDTRIVNMIRENQKFIVAEPPSVNFERKTIVLVDSDPRAKKYNNQHWWAKMTLGENYWTTNQSIICTPSNEKQKKIKDITKITGKKRNLLEIHKHTAPNSKSIKKLDCASSKDLKETADGKIEFSKNSLNRNHLWKVMAIQDSQRKREENIFDQITVLHDRSKRKVNSSCSPRVLDQPRDIYTALHTSIIAKIDAQNKTILTRTTKTTTDKKNKN